MVRRRRSQLRLDGVLRIMIVDKIEAIGLMLIGLDSLLTGKPDSMVSRNGIRQLAGCIDALSNYKSFEFYLSDGGYSRIWMDCWDGTIFLTSNSRIEVKEKWDAPQVQKIVRDLRIAIEPEPGHYTRPEQIS